MREKEPMFAPVSFGVLKLIPKRAENAVFLCSEKFQILDDLFFVFHGEAMKRIAHGE